MKSSKKALAAALALAMVVTAVPVTPAEAASTAKLSAKSVTVAAGTAKKQTKSIKVTVPSTWKSAKIRVSSSNKKVATVKTSSVKSGKATVKVTAVKKGTAKVTVKVTAKKGKKAVKKTLYATAKVVNAGIRFTNAPAEVDVGSTTKFTTKVCPSTSVVSFATSDPEIATVDADGNVTALKAGNVTIKATSDYGKTAETAVSIKAVIEAATKIESVKVVDAKTLEIVFDGKVKDTTKDSFKVTRTATEVKMAAPKWSEDGKSAVLASETALQAGTYTVAYGTMTGTVEVQAQKASKIEIRTKKIPLGDSSSPQKVYYSVLDQYGTDMGITSNKLTVTATNMTRNHKLEAKGDASFKDYFTVTNHPEKNDAVGDKIAVVAYLKSDVSILAKEELEIANIYTKDFTFGTPDSGDAKDKNIYVNKDSYTYSLPYTAADTEGNPVTLTTTKNSVLQPNSSQSATRNNITFISSNTNTIDPKQFKIDKDGKLTFKTGSYASKVTITAINDVTGATTSVEINVGDSSEIRTFETAAKTIPRNESGQTYKADITAKDQYGAVMKEADIAKDELDKKFTISAAGQGTITAKITADGKYVEFTGLDTTKLKTGDSITIKFVNKKDPSQISDVVLNIGERRMPEKVTVDPVKTLFVNGDKATKLGITVLDNYGDKMDKSGSNLTLTVDPTDAKGAYTVNNHTEKVSVKGDGLGTIEIEAADTPSGKVDTDATVLVKVAFMNDDDESDNLDDVKVTIPVSKMADKFEVGFVDEADKDKTFKSGETANVKVIAKNGADKLGKFTGNVAVKEDVMKGATSLSTTNKTLSFKNGVAETSFTVKAGTTKVAYTIIGDSKKIASGTYNESNGVVLNVKSKASAEAATKYSVASVSGGSIEITAQNAAGDTYTDYAGQKALKITVKDAVTKKDVTDKYFTGLNSGTIIVTFTKGKVAIEKAAGFSTSGTYEITVKEVDGDGFEGSTFITLPTLP